MAHLGPDEPAIAEEPVGRGDVARLQSDTNGAGGNGLRSLDDGRSDQAFEPPLTAKLLHARGIALAPAAEMKIVSDHHARELQFLRQQIHEARRRQRSKIPAEAPLENAVESETREDFELYGFGRQTEKRPVGLEERARMRLEGDDRCRPVGALGHLQEMLVPPVYAIEIADGGDGSPEVLRHGLAIAADRERGGHQGENLGTHLWTDRCGATLSKSTRWVKPVRSDVLEEQAYIVACSQETALECLC